MPVVFLSGSPPCLGAGDTIVGKVCEVFRQGCSIVKGVDALFIGGAIFQKNRNPHLMDIPTFVARNEDPYRVCEFFAIVWSASPIVRFSCIKGLGS